MKDHPDTQRLLDIVNRFSRAKILLLGDFVADEFIDGEISRVSREAPVLILKHRGTAIVPGGAANAANNLADLEAQVFPFSVVGQDEAGRRLIDMFKAKGVRVNGLLTDRSYSTPTKSRILAGSAHTTHQQVVRIDREPASAPHSGVISRIYQLALKNASRVDAMVISDYGLGWITPGRIASLRALAKKRGIPILLDSRYRLRGFRGFTAATPNEAEVEAALGVSIGNNLRALEPAGRRLLRHLGSEALLVTRGREGMALFERGRKTVHIPIFGTDQITDVTGAGDTVIAVFTLALACGANFVEAAHLSNYAGGLVVMKHGTATVRLKELISAVQSETR
ncbi:MAG: PfkB family carbohydrate kinase [Acidobacteriia bacterium]|nr:PfkB family carbohydrate kinase [Terriglobia bacterium]